jgi:hypothetical protein
MRSATWAQWTVWCVLLKQKNRPTTALFSSKRESKYLKNIRNSLGTIGEALGSLTGQKYCFKKD